MIRLIGLAVIIVSLAAAEVIYVRLIAPQPNLPAASDTTTEAIIIRFDTNPTGCIGEGRNWGNYPRC